MNELNEFDPVQSRNSAIRMAEHFESTGQLGRAKDQLLEALATDPENTEIHCKLGYVLLLLEKPHEARRHARTVLAADGENIQALALMGGIHSELGENREAEKFYLSALRLAPHDPVLLRLYGRLMFRVDEHQKAHDLFLASLELDPNDEITTGLLSLVQMELGKGSDARHLSEKNISNAPEEAFAHLTMAATHYQSGRIWTAKRHAREALRLDPNEEASAKLYIEIDRSSRLIGLPYYYWSLLLEKIPGGPFAVWIGFVVMIKVLPQSPAVTWIAGAYILFVIYTWLAQPLMKLWTKIRPSPVGRL